MPDVHEQDQQCQQPGVQWQRQGAHWQRQTFAFAPVADDEPTLAGIARLAPAGTGQVEPEAPPQDLPRPSRNDPGRDSNLF